MKGVPVVHVGGKAVPAVALGCAYLGTKLDRGASFRILDAFREAGGRLLDTANSYAAWMPGGRGGESEETIGAWLRERGAVDFAVVTKAGFGFGGVPDGTAPEVILREAEASARRLGRESLDCFLVHKLDPAVAPEAVAGALAELLYRGRAASVGASNYPEGDFDRLSALVPGGLSVLQNHFPALPCADPAPLADYGWTAPDAAALDRAAARGIVAMAHTALLWGCAARNGPLPPAYDSPAARGLRDGFLRRAAAEGRDPAAVALSSLVFRPRPFVPVFGASSAEQVAAALSDLAP